jgi:acyl dehydratase
VRYGDALTARLRVASKRETTSPERGLVSFAVELRNQRGEVAQEGELVELVLRRLPAAQ